MDAEVSTHIFLTMIIEESVLFHVVWTNFVVAIILMWYTRNIYIFFSSTEHCAWAIISTKEFKSCVTCISFALLYCKTELSAVKFFYFVICLLIASISSITVPFKRPHLSSNRECRDSVATWGFDHLSPPSSTSSSNLIHLKKILK
jgi:hypothetical protein